LNMSMLGPKIDELRSRVQSKIAAVKARVPMLGQGLSSQIQIGKGALMEKVKSQLQMVTAKVEELRPRILPKVAEFKPGTAISQVFGQGRIARGQVAETARSAIADEVSKKEFSDLLSIEP